MSTRNNRLADPERLAALEATGLLDSLPQRSFDRFTYLLSKVLDVPISLVSLVDDKRQFFKSTVGTELRETPLSHSYCKYVVVDQEPLVVPDARENSDLRNNGALLEMGAIAYLGVPLLGPNGHVLGSLCAIDKKVRHWTDEELELVQELSEIVMSEIAAEQRLAERVALLDTLLETESRLDLALKAGKMGAWEWNLQTDHVILSDLAYEIWDISPDGAASADLILSRIHPADAPRVKGALEAAIEHDAAYDEEFRIVRRDGVERWLAGRGQVVRGDDGNATHIRGINYDISSEKQTEEALLQLNNELEDRIEERTRELELVNKELEAFNYSVSHDLRAPLRGIDGFSSALQVEYGDDLDETALHYLNRVRVGAQRMEELIDDLLDLSRVSRSELRLTSVNVTELAQNIADDLLETATEPKPEFEISPGMTTLADKRLLKVALENLMNNAVKFSGNQPAPCITVGQAEAGEFYVRDNGVGFDMKYADKLFIPFQRLHTRTEFEGSGIGLTTVQRIINRHGGRLWADAQAGEGASFFFTLPVAKARIYAAPEEIAKVG